MKKTEAVSVRKKDFFDGLKSFYGESVRERSIAIPDSVHDKMVEASNRLKKPLYEAYTEAARSYVKAQGVASEIPNIGRISAEEERLVSEIIELYRNRQKSVQAKEVLNAIRLLIESTRKP